MDAINLNDISNKEKKAGLLFKIEKNTSLEELKVSLSMAEKALQDHLERRGTKLIPSKTNVNIEDNDTSIKVKLSIVYKDFDGTILPIESE